MGDFALMVFTGEVPLPRAGCGDVVSVTTPKTIGLVTCCPRLWLCLLGGSIDGLWISFLLLILAVLLFGSLPFRLLCMVARLAQGSSDKALGLFVFLPPSDDGGPAGWQVKDPLCILELFPTAEDVVTEDHFLRL